MRVNISAYHSSGSLLKTGQARWYKEREEGSASDGSRKGAP
jgi:hypothetical protein